MRDTLLLIVFCWSSFAMAETLNGTVVDADGAVLPQSIVIIEGWKANEVNQSMAKDPVVVRPDKDGRFEVSIEPGLYDIFVSCAFCKPDSKQIKVLPRKINTVDFKMKMSRHVDLLE